MNGSRVHVGTPSNDFSGWTTTEVCFHNFANLSTEIDEYVRSPKFSSLGHEWRSKIFPGGEEDSDEGYVPSILLIRQIRASKLSMATVSKMPQAKKWCTKNQTQMILQLVVVDATTAVVLLILPNDQRL